MTQREKIARILSTKLWAVANSQDHSDCAGWEELPVWVQDIYLQAADAVLLEGGL